MQMNITQPLWLYMYTFVYASIQSVKFVAVSVLPCFFRRPIESVQIISTMMEVKYYIGVNVGVRRVLGWSNLRRMSHFKGGSYQVVNSSFVQNKRGMSALLVFKTPPMLQLVSFHQCSLRSDGKLSSVAIQPWLHPIWDSAGEPGEQRRDWLWVCCTDMVFT